MPVVLVFVIDVAMRTLYQLQLAQASGRSQQELTAVRRNGLPRLVLAEVSATRLQHLPAIGNEHGAGYR